MAVATECLGRDEIIVSPVVHKKQQYFSDMRLKYFFYYLLFICMICNSKSKDWLTLLFVELYFFHVKEVTLCLKQASKFINWCKTNTTKDIIQGIGNINRQDSHIFEVFFIVSPSEMQVIIVAFSALVRTSIRSTRLEEVDKTLDVRRRCQII